MNHGLYQLPQGSQFRWSQAGERHSGTSVFRGWVTLGFGPPRLTPVSRQGRRDLQECPGLELREWNTQWGMKMCHCLLFSKFLNYSNKEAEPPSVTCSGRREPNHKYHRSSMWTYASLGVSVSSPWVYWRCQKHLWHDCWPVCLSPSQFSSFFLYPEIWPLGLGLVPLLSFLKISLANCFHIVFRLALASKSLSVFSPCVLSSRFVTESSQMPLLGKHIQLTFDNAPRHSPCIAIGTSKLITPSLIFIHHCLIFLPRCPSGAGIGWGRVALRVV